MFKEKISNTAIKFIGPSAETNTVLSFKRSMNYIFASGTTLQWDFLCNDVRQVARDACLLEHLEVG
jgi:hypothetical protein